MASSNFFIDLEEDSGPAVFKLRCDSCKFAGRSIVACGYCLTCKGKLCQECYDNHLREDATASHHVTILRAETKINPIKCDVRTTERCRKHPEHFLETYCSKHDAICCRTCSSNRHNRCDLISLTEAAVGVRGSEHHRKIVGEVKQMLKHFKSTQKSREEESISIDTQAEAVVSDVRKYREKINSILDEMEIAALQHNDEVASKLSTTTNEHIKRCQGIIPILEKTCRRLNAARSRTGEQDLYITLHTANKRLQRYQEALDDIKEQSKTFSFEFVKEKVITELLQKIGEIGEIDVHSPEEDTFEPNGDRHLAPIKNPPRVSVGLEDLRIESKEMSKHVKTLPSRPQKTSTPRSAKLPLGSTLKPIIPVEQEDESPPYSRPTTPWRLKSLENKYDEELGEQPMSPVPPANQYNRNSLDRVCSITGSDYLEDGRLVLVDSKNKRLELFDRSYNPLYQLDLPFWPWDVSTLSQNKVAVTCLGENSVRILSVDKASEVDVESEIQTDRQCWGVAFHSPNLYVSCGLKDEAEVHIYSRDGQFRQKIRLKAGTLDWPSYLAVDEASNNLYISDLYKGIVCLSVSDTKMAPLYQYNIPNVKFYCGVAVDSHSQLYVCTQHPNGVYRINVKQRSIKSLVDSGGVVAEPMSISYNRTMDTLMVTFYKSNEVKLFQASLEK